MKPKFCAVSIITVLSLASPMFGATVSYNFEAVGSGSNSDARLVGQLSFDLDGAPLFATDRFITKHSEVGYFSATVQGGLQNGATINAESVSIHSMYSNFTNIFLGKTDNAALLLRRRNAPFETAADLSVLSFTSGAIWMRGDNSNSPSLRRYALTSVSAQNLVPVPLPATFPLFLGACLGAAFLGRKREEV